MQQVFANAGNRLIPLFLIVLLYVGAGHAGTDPAELCDHAAQMAARETKVPLNVLKAITRTETGRGKPGDLRPWPWTVNVEGQGIWFDTPQQAQVYLFRRFREGARSFDVGCFQINYKWHGHAFNSLEEMFDPVANASYAATFLSRLHAEHGDWTKAVGAYHSRTPEYAGRYISRYTEVRQGMAENATAPASTTDRRLPLIQGPSNPESRGSLFPLSETTATSLFTSAAGVDR